MMPKVNPEILAWARERAGFSTEVAVHKLGLSGENAVQRLVAIERGDEEPSRSLLVKMSEKYRRPLLTFYLSNPPKRSEIGKDFRTLPDGAAPDIEALVETLLRDVHARQGLVKAALEEAEEAQPLAYVGSFSVAQGVNAVAAAIRETLKFEVADFRNQQNVSAAFNFLREKVEAAGVFVLLLGNLGSHHTDIATNVFRGFALADAIAPFIVINENDSRAAWSFTLLHEFAHLVLGETGISGYDGEADIEKFCDSVAALVLLDPRELRDIAPRGLEVPELKKRIDDFAAARNVSRKMVAYNLLRSRTISIGTYRALTAMFDAERIATADRASEREGGPNYYVVRRHRIGSALIRLVGRMVANGTLSTTKAGRVLGVKPTNVARVVEPASRAA